MDAFGGEGAFQRARIGEVMDGDDDVTVWL